MKQDKKKGQQERLFHWQTELQKALMKHDKAHMDKLEKIYDGDRQLRPLTANDVKKCSEQPFTAPHVWNICHENIESMVDSNIPQPKVMARRKKDEQLAVKIEAMLRNELERMPFEEINDLMERTVPIQGGGLYLVEWDQTVKGPRTMGDVVVSPMHPKLVVPQPGVFTGIEDMDYIFLQIPQSKGYIKRRYGVDVELESEEEPENKSATGESQSDEDTTVTQNVVYYRQEDGCIGLFSWINNIVLEDLDDYQSRRRKVCAVCGQPKQQDRMSMEEPTLDGTPPDPERARKVDENTCPYCGSQEWETLPTDTEELLVELSPEQIFLLGLDMTQLDGFVESDDEGTPHYFVFADVPAYKPDVYPLVLQKNVSAYGKFLGDSDVEKIQDQQNTLNRLEKKIIDRIVKAGSKITAPITTKINFNEAEDGDVIYLNDAAEKNMIGVEDFNGNLEYEMAFRAEVYEEARRILGITDSFQGRKDTTATSGAAKEFSAAQSAGRLESKRIMKNAAYSRLFELMFKFKLAYCDEPRQITRRDEKGDLVYDSFDKRDFLELDERTGQWVWLDDFIFGTDSSATLAGNRQAMWQEATAHFQAGAFGNPQDTSTQILYWSKLEELHYPGAATTKAYLIDRQKEQQAAMAAQQQANMMAQQQQAMQQQAAALGGTQQAMTLPV